jgi:hypothetical protein
LTALFYCLFPFNSFGVSGNALKIAIGAFNVEGKLFYLLFFSRQLARQFPWNWPKTSGRLLCIFFFLMLKIFSKKGGKIDCWNEALLDIKNPLSLREFIIKKSQLMPFIRQKAYAAMNFVNKK